MCIQFHHDITQTSQSSNYRPRFSLCFRGPSIISPRSTHYPLEATVHYHLDPSITDPTHQQPVTFSTRSTPLAQNEQLEFCYKLYSTPSLDFDSLLRFRRNRTLVRPDRTQSHDSTLPIISEKGFVQVAPGEDVVFELSLKLDYWLQELETGKAYWLQFAGKEDVIKYWRYGSLQVSIQSVWLVVILRDGMLTIFVQGTGPANVRS